MSRRGAVVAVAVSVVVVVLLLVWLLAGRGEPSGDGDTAVVEPSSEETAETPDAAAAESEATGPQFELYFPGFGKRLYAERRPVPPSPDGPPEALRDRVRAVVEALLAGPQSSGRTRPLPEGVTLASVYLGQGGVAYLDFQAPEGGRPPAGGSMAELLTVYSIVNSVMRNVPQVRAVVLLWNGNQPATFSGHVDTSRPLTANPRLLAG